MKERAFAFGKSRSLVGIVTLPEDEARNPRTPVLILLNAGLVHRVGPNRLHVTMARTMAKRGFVSVRFDLSGIGDSLPRLDSVPFPRSAVLDVQEVMDDISTLTGTQRFCLMGLSSGALVSLATALADQRVAGAVIVNPHGFWSSAEMGAHVENLSVARIYRGNLRRVESWRRLFTGKTNYRRLVETLWYRIAGRHRAAHETSLTVNGIDQQLTAFLRLEIPILLMFSDKDRGLDNFDHILGRDWRRGLGKNIHLAVIQDANHTLAVPSHLRQAVASVDRWMTDRWPVSLDLA